jgi:3-oxoacyl-[acyl-carrier protein] reductase
VEIGFEGSTVLVTGAVRGIGRGIAHAFAARGAKVYAADVLAAELDEVVDTAAPKRGGEVVARALDVTDGGAVAALVAEIETASGRGRVDIVVHSAGGVRGQVAKPIEAVSDAEWREIFEVNVTGAFNLARAVTPAMKQAGGGRIVVISSRAGLGVSLTGIQSYAMSKAGQLGFVRQLAHELGPFAITVNAIAPGFMRTSPDYERQWQSYGAEGQQAMIERIALRRLGKPEDIAHAVMFLASDYASWITGQTLAVSGGP